MWLPPAADGRYPDGAIPVCSQQAFSSCPSPKDGGVCGDQPHWWVGASYNQPQTHTMITVHGGTFEKPRDQFVHDVLKGFV